MDGCKVYYSIRQKYCTWSLHDRGCYQVAVSQHGIVEFFLKYAIKSAFFRVSTLLLRYLKLNTVVGESRFFSAAKTHAVQGPCIILLPDTIVVGMLEKKKWTSCALRPIVP